MPIDHPKRREERWALILSTLGDRCSRCRQQYPPVVYDLHHPDGKSGRDEMPSKIIRQATDAVFREHLKRWQLYCANCHRLHHAEIGDWHPARKPKYRGFCVVCLKPMFSSAPGRLSSHPGACRRTFHKQLQQRWRLRRRGQLQTNH